MIDVIIVKRFIVTVAPKDSSLAAVNDAIEMESCVQRLGRFSERGLAVAYRLKLSDGVTYQIQDVTLEELTGEITVTLEGGWERVGKRYDGDVSGVWETKCREHLADLIGDHVNAGWEVVNVESDGSKNVPKISASFWKQISVDGEPGSLSALLTRQAPIDLDTRNAVVTFQPILLGDQQEQPIETVTESDGSRHTIEVTLKESIDHRPLDESMDELQSIFNRSCDDHRSRGWIVSELHSFDAITGLVHEESVGDE